MHIHKCQPTDIQIRQQRQEIISKFVKQPRNKLRSKHCQHKIIVTTISNEFLRVRSKRVTERIIIKLRRIYVSIFKLICIKVI